MATTNGNTLEPEDRDWEVDALAAAIFTETFGLDYAQAFAEAERQVDELLAFAAHWDAYAQPEPTVPPAGPVPIALADQEMSAEEAAEWAGEALYVPSALEPHEQRAMDKALFERARGLRPQIVGRFAFVPSRTSGGTVYRTPLDGSSCNCQAGEAGKLCWHRMAVVLERELAA